MPALSPLAHDLPSQDEDLFDFSQAAPARSHPSVREIRLLAVPVAHEPPPGAMETLLPKLLPWIGAQAAAAVMLAACVAQAMPQTAPKPETAGLDFALRLGEGAVPSPLPAGLDDGFRLRLSRPGAD